MRIKIKKNLLSFKRSETLVVYVAEKFYKYDAWTLSLKDPDRIKKLKAKFVKFQKVNSTEAWIIPVTAIDFNFTEKVAYRPNGTTEERIIVPISSMTKLKG